PSLSSTSLSPPRPSHSSPTRRSSDLEGPRRLDQPVNPPRPYQGLFGNSPTVDAGTSERPRLHERHAGAELHALLQGVDAGRAATDDEEVVAIDHRLPPTRVVRVVVSE